MKKYVITVCIIMFVFISNVYPQVSTTMFVPKDENAFGLTGMLSTESESGGRVTYYDGILSYIYNGSLEVGVGYGISSYIDNDDSYWDSNMNTFSFGGYYHIKNKEIPFTIKIGGYYGFGSYSSDFLDDENITAELEGSAVGGGLYKNINKNPEFKLSPYMNFHSISREITYEYYHGNNISDEDSYTSIEFGVAVNFNNNIWIAPKIAKVDGDTKFGVDFGIIIRN